MLGVIWLRKDQDHFQLAARVIMVLANLSMLLDPMANYKEEKIFTVAFLNIRGQSGLPISKQLQIESFIKYNQCDIVHIQEAHIDKDSFSTCDFISSTFNILPNNGLNTIHLQQNRWLINFLSREKSYFR